MKPLDHSENLKTKWQKIASSSSQNISIPRPLTARNSKQILRSLNHRKKKKQFLKEMRESNHTETEPQVADESLVTDDDSNGGNHGQTQNPIQMLLRVATSI
jgi:hypothetical protein